MGTVTLSGGVVSVGVEVVCVPSCRSGTVGREDWLVACAEARVSRWTVVGGSRLGFGTGFISVVGGVVSAEGELGLGGDSVTAVTGVGGSGRGVRPVRSGVGLELELLLRGPGGELAGDGDFGCGGESGTGVPVVDGLGVGLRPLGAGLGLEVDLFLRAMMRIDA